MSAAKHSPMVVSAARALCKRSAEVCNTDAEDSWKFYSDDFLADAQAALDAAGAPELLMALQMLYYETADYIRLNNLGGMDNQCMQLARATLAKATGSAT